MILQVRTTTTLHLVRGPSDERLAKVTNEEGRVRLAIDIGNKAVEVLLLPEEAEALGDCLQGYAADARRYSEKPPGLNSGRAVSK